MTRLQQEYVTTIVPKLRERLGIDNVMDVPRIIKITLNMGVGETITDKKVIEKAVQDGLMTKEMAAWAHAVRLDANDQRHADQAADLPSEEDAKRCIEFARALGEFLFVLPTRIQRGISGAAS